MTLEERPLRPAEREITDHILVPKAANTHIATVYMPIRKPSIWERMFTR